MKLRNINQVNDFLMAVDKCKGNVWLKFKNADWFNLKSELSRYVALGALICDHGDELELFCDKIEDETNFYEFFDNHNDVL